MQRQAVLAINTANYHWQKYASITAAAEAIRELYPRLTTIAVPAVRPMRINIGKALDSGGVAYGHWWTRVPATIDIAGIERIVRRERLILDLDNAGREKWSSMTDEQLAKVHDLATSPD